MSDWTTIHPRDARGREIRISPSGIVVVEDVLPDGSFRHTRVTPAGDHVQATEATAQKAWRAARKLVP